MFQLTSRCPKSCGQTGLRLIRGQREATQRNLVSASATVVVNRSRNQSQWKPNVLLQTHQEKLLHRIIKRTMADLPDHIKVSLPALSPTMEVGTIVSWEKKEGDAVSEGDLLCDIETDKATMGFETPEEGYLAKVLLPSGSKDIPIGKLLCILVRDEGDVVAFKDFVDDGASTPAPSTPAPPKAAPAPAPAAPSQPAAVPSPAMSSAAPRPPVGPGSRAFASPAAKRLAAERGIDLSQIARGSGMDGMITTKDLDGVSPSAMAGPAAGGIPGVGTPISTYGGMPPPQGPVTDNEISNMRRTIAKRLQSSKLEIPHYYLTVECEVDNLMKLRADINKQYEKEEIKLSVNDFIIKAVALASKRVPACNSAWMDTSIRQYNTVDVSVAVDTGSGLITPIITSAEAKGLAEISDSIKEMAGRAKDGKLLPHEFQGGTITVSNLGMFGIEHFTAIINPPQACILAIGGTSKKAVVDSEGNYKSVQTMKVTLSCDHRVVDGAVGAQWLKHFKKFVEQPSSMLL